MTPNASNHDDVVAYAVAFPVPYRGAVAVPANLDASVVVVVVAAAVVVLVAWEDASGDQIDAANATEGALNMLAVDHHQKTWD